jgi:general secretion pathway protein G
MVAFQQHNLDRVRLLAKSSDEEVRMTFYTIHLLRKRRRRLLGRNEAGFTLVEILVVITIIGLIMALVGPRVINYLGESKVKAAKIQIASFESALDLYYLDMGRYPSGSEGLAALVRRSGGDATWSGPYLKNGMVPNDPWGRPYVYRSPGEHGGTYDIISYGSDGQEGGAGTAADIVSWAK